MKQFAFAYLCFFTNDLVIHFISADTWQEAVKKGYRLCYSDESSISWVDSIPNDLAKAKQYFFDCDAMFDVKELPSAEEKAS